jgi:hypothetical protein
MKNLIIVFLLISYNSSLISQNVAINNKGSKPDPSAMLDVSSTTGGMLIPRMTTVQMNAITNPAPGLQIFNTNTNCIEYFNGASWQNVVCPCTAPPPAPGVISGNTTACISSAGNVYAIAAVTGATSYTWSVPTGATITAGLGTTSITVTFGSVSGNITVAAFNSCGTSGTSSLAVALSTFPSPPAIPSGNATPLINDTITYTIPAVAGATGYLWSVSTSNGSVNGGQGTTSAAIIFSGTPATMNICVYDSNACGNSAASCLSVTTTSCAHGSVTFTYNGSIQTWVVPSCVSSITIEAFGAQGGATTGENGNGNWTGGLGADIKGAFTVSGGQSISVLVGEAGTAASGSSCTSGGGGGSWAVSNTTLLLVAGGGGGGFMCNALGGVNGGNGNSGNNGGNGVSANVNRSAAAGGTGGNGGTGCYGGGGGGWLSAGTSTCSGAGGGAYPGSSVAGGGGYGGGGGGYNSGCCGGSGGGGGYSGGSTGTSDGCAGGGGGSYNNGTNQSNTSGVQTGNGRVVINY